jgi:hydroxymethylpyrimidine pyrophosphatase-like HAD family hydrolase
MPPLRCLYTDLDGTLLGRGASLLHDGEGAFTMLGVRALEACWRADVEVVIFSGRRRAQVAEDARLLGQTAFIYEVGCGLSVDGEDEYLTGERQPRPEATVHAQVAASGAPDLLLEAFPGRLEPHDPWHHERHFSHLFRGGLEPGEADAVLAAHGHEDLRLVDNGAIRRVSPTLRLDRPAHAFHLIPRSASKANAVRRHMQIRGYAPEDCIAAGDSREDLGAAAAVGTFWLVANALAKDPSLAGEVAEADNVRVAEEANGAGVYEAVITTLAEAG